jgi:hypothetical protein
MLKNYNLKNCVKIKRNGSTKQSDSKKLIGAILEI